MAKQLQIRRGTTAQHASFTGLVGEITVDTDTDQLRVHDGSTAGGILQGPPLGSIVAVASGVTGAYTLPSTGAVGVGGWMLCDGASIPGAATLSGSVPTLNDGRFLQGNTHANVGGVGAGTKSLSEGELAAHTHTGASHQHAGVAHTHTMNGHSHSGGGHSHSHNHGVASISYGASNFNNAGGWLTYHSNSGRYTTNNASGASGNNTGTANGNTGSTTPGSVGATTPGAGGSTGSGTSFDVIPKYLRVVYLIRVQ